MFLSQLKQSLATLGFSLVLTFLPFSYPQAASANQFSPTAGPQLDKELTALVGDTGTQVPGLGVIVYQNGHKVYSKFLGHRYIDAKNSAKNLPITAATRFRVASVAKQFTAFSILQLIDQGKLALDGDISQYLGFTLRNPNYPDTPLTVRMLLSHTSSLRDGKLYAIPPEYSVREMFTPTGKYWEAGKHFAPAGQAPGQYFQYGNINYGLLGTIIEAVTKERFDLYQKTHILKALDIQADYLPGNLPPDQYKLVGNIYQKQQNGTWQEKGPWVAQINGYPAKQPPADYVLIQNPDARQTDTWYSLKNYQSGTNATIFSPQGGLLLSYNDLEHCLQLLLNKGKFRGRQIIKPALMQEMLTPQWRYDAKLKNGSTYGGTIEAYCMAEFPIFGNSTSRVCKDHEINLLGHTGEAYGLLSGIFITPDHKNGFLYMMNGEAVAEDDDSRSAGTFSSNYIWEENIMNAICKNVFFSGK